MKQINTPLRYPGGKQKLTPFILELMNENNLVGGEYAEPYAGGAGVAIRLLLKGHVSHIHLNDSCVGVYSFWQSILKKTNEFCERIKNAQLTVEEWRRQKEILSRPSEFNEFDVGFSMFYLNRCNRSGILSGGLIGGPKQNGKWKMDARFYRDELIRRIKVIALKKESITVKNLDAEKFILEYLPKLPEKSLVYCDPPYFHKAKWLYQNHYAQKDHSRIAEVIQQNIKQPWVVSYDGVTEILNYYSNRKHFLYELQYNADKAYKGTEAFFFSDDLKLPATSTVSYINEALKIN